MFRKFANIINNIYIYIGNYANIINKIYIQEILQQIRKFTYNTRIEFLQLFQKIIQMIMRNTHSGKNNEKYTLSFSSLPTVTEKKPTPNFCH